MAVIDVFAWTPLFLTDAVNINIKVLNVEDILPLTDSIRTNIHIQSVEHVLYLNDQVLGNKTLGLEVESELALTQDGRRTPIVVTASDHLEFYQSATVVGTWPDVKHTLALVDEAVAVLAKGTYDVLTLTQSVQVTKSVTVSAANVLVMESLATVYIPDQFWQSFDAVVVNP